MEEFMTSSISVSVNKGSADEEMSLFRASMEDAASRLAEGVKPETISNEKIQKGDEILGTYQVASDAIHGGMGRFAVTCAAADHGQRVGSATISLSLFT